MPAHRATAGLPETSLAVLAGSQLEVATQAESTWGQVLTEDGQQKPSGSVRIRPKRGSVFLPIEKVLLRFFLAHASKCELTKGKAQFSSRPHQSQQLPVSE